MHTSTMLKGLRHAAAGTALALACGAASAHPGHDVQGLVHGLTHPLGLDHLLAMVAVGAWSARALPARRAVLGPVVFMLALLAGALGGLSTGALPGVEALVALSVVLMGALLAGGSRWSMPMGLGLIGVSALAHGLAHGAEWPASTSVLSYVLGFMACTAVLHAAGLSLGLLARRASPRWWSLAGTAVGAAGVFLLTR